tara:strand:+ start:36 stop:935 length:900 start_codon:yes stop_codon:yes gene_type:complete
MKTFAYPYPNLFPYIENKPLWFYSVDKRGYKEFKEPLKIWDYNACLEIQCKIPWNIKEIFEKANLVEIQKFSRVAIIEISSPGQICSCRSKIYEVSLEGEDKFENPISFKIKSLNNSSSIQFRFIIYTDECELNSFNYKKGSILYDEFSTLVLEGESANISIQRRDFEKHFKVNNAMWYIEFTGTNLYQTFNETHTLYLNTNKKNLVDEISKSIYLKDAITIDLISTIMISTLISEDFDIDFDEDYPENSLGFQIKEWLKDFDVETTSNLENFRNEIQYNQNIFIRKCQDLFCTDFEES